MTDPKPRVPDLEGRLDFIFRQLADMCDAPLSVWAQAFWPAAGKLALAWFAFNLQNMFLAYIRPKMRVEGGRSLRHWGGGDKGKRGRLRSKLGKIVGFDPGEWVGERLPGAELFHERIPLPGEMMFWTIEGIAERIGYWWMVVDLLSEFLYDWMSAVAASRYCQAREDSVFLGEFHDQPILGVEGWVVAGWGTPLKMRHIGFYNGFGVSPERGPGIVYYNIAATVLSPDTPDPWIETRIRCLAGPSSGLEIIQHNVGILGQEIGGQVGLPCQAGDTWIAETRVNGLWNIGLGRFYLHCPAAP